jgi:hypothetical protein
MLRDEREERREGAELGGEGSEWGMKGGKEGKQKVLGTGSSASDTFQFIFTKLTFLFHRRGAEEEKRAAQAARDAVGGARVYKES